MIASLIVSIGRATRRRAAQVVREGTAVEREGRSAAAAFSDGAGSGAEAQGRDDGDAGDGGAMTQTERAALIRSS
jgi:hypothetical protein